MSARGTTMLYPSLAPRESGPWLVVIHRDARRATFTTCRSRRAAERLAARLIGRGLCATVSREVVR